MLSVASYLICVYILPDLAIFYFVTCLAGKQKGYDYPTFLTCYKLQKKKKVVKNSFACVTNLSINVSHSLMMAHIINLPLPPPPPKHTICYIVFVLGNSNYITCFNSFAKKSRISQFFLYIIICLLYVIGSLIIWGK